VKLTLMINVINGWNRLAVGFGLWVDPADVKASLKAAPRDDVRGPTMRRRRRSTRCGRS
jgi:hypothetical protein